MKSNRTLQKILLYFGCALVLVSAVFFIVAFLNGRKYSVDIGKAAGFLESVIPERTAGIKEERSNREMPSVFCDGQDYTALLSVPKLSVTLPVRSSWDKTAVRHVPCRFTGSAYDGTLIIGGTDAKGQFDFVPKMDVGDEVGVTDMKGSVFTYTVSTVKHAQNAKAETLMDEKYDLTLFAKDRKTGDWLLVRCKMK